MANDLNKMDYKAEFLRGYPNGGLELDRYELNTGVSVEAGDLVTVNSSSKLVKVAASADATFAGIVVKGDLDDKSVALSKKPLVLWGNYVVRTQKYSGSVTVGGGVTADDGVFKAAVANAPMGYVTQIITGTGGEPNSIVVIVR